MKRLSLLITAFAVSPFLFSQNIGVGESAPATKLEIKGDSGTDLVNIKDQSNNSRFYIENNGEVGIGTASPSYKLDIAAGDGGIRIGPNTSFGENLILGGWTGSVTDARVATSNGNLHLDSKAGGSDIYFNHYHDGDIFMAAGASQGNVGIGTASPSFKLDVAGTGRYTGQLTIPLTPSANAHAASKKYVDDQVTGSDEWDKSGNDIFNNNSGNVGIGTSNPGTKLHVAGKGRIEKTVHSAGASDYHLELYSPDSGDPNNEVSLRFHQGGQYYGQIRYRSGGFRFTQGNSDNLVKINAGEGYFSGNMGIGTANPSAQLHTTGSVRFANYGNGLLGVDASGNLLSRSMGVSGTGISISNGNGVSGNPTVSLNYGNSSTGGAYPQGNFGQFQPHSNTTDFNTVPSHWGWNYVQGTTNAPNTISTQWYRGVFSLGASYPSRGSGGYSMELAYPRNNHSTAGVWMRTVENGSIGGWTRIDGSADNGNFIQNQTATNQAASFRINGNGIFEGGNVGIGTNAPNGKLDIYTTSANGDGAVFAPAITLDNNFTIQTYIDKNLSGGGWAGRTTYAGQCCNNLALQPDAGTVSIGGTSSNYAANKFNVIGQSYFSGKIGIGTTAPAESIHVSNGNNSVALFGPNSSWNSYLYVGAGTDRTVANRAQVISTSGNLHLDAGTGQNIYIANYTGSNTFMQTGGGSVGIGNTNPGAKLDVSGNIKANGNSEFAASDNGSTSYSVAALELRESGFGGAGNLPPRLSFHWGGIVASQIAIEANGTIAIRNNPGTGYEDFRCLTVTSNGIRETSDARLKEEINPISGALEKVTQMQGVTYNWDLSVDRNEGLDESLQYGLIAQELEKVIPELVATDEEGWKSIEYSHLVPVLIEAIKEQQNKMEAMEARHADEMNCVQQQMEDFSSMAKDIEMLKAALNSSTYSASK